MALAGVRVLELTSGVAGPYAGMFLADHGADVIKVEPVRASDRPEAGVSYRVAGNTLFPLPGARVDAADKVMPSEGDDADDAGAQASSLAATAASLAGAAVDAAALATDPEDGADGDPFRSQPGFQTLNRGKRSVRLDLATEAGRAAVRRIAATVDVVLVDWTQEEAELVGCDRATLEAAHAEAAAAVAASRPPVAGADSDSDWRDDDVDAPRRLLYVALPPYGTVGELHDKHAAGTGAYAYSPMLLAAATGMMATQISATGDPVYHVLPLASYSTGALTAIAVVASLLGLKTGAVGSGWAAHEAAGGAGRAGDAASVSTYVSTAAAAAASREAYHVEVSHLAGTMSLLHAADRRMLHQHPMGSLGPIGCYRSYQAADGQWFFMACANEGFFRRMLRAMGPDFEALAKDPRMAEAWVFTNQAAGPRECLVPALEAAIRAKPRAHWLELFNAADVPVQPVQTRAAFMASDLVAGNDMAVHVSHPRLGRVDMIGVPVKLTGSPGAVRGRAPLLGEHTAAVTAEVDALFARAAARPARGRLAGLDDVDGSDGDGSLTLSRGHGSSASLASEGSEAGVTSAGRRSSASLGPGSATGSGDADGEGASSLPSSVASAGLASGHTSPSSSPRFASTLPPPVPPRHTVGGSGSGSGAATEARPRVWPPRTKAAAAKAGDGASVPAHLPLRGVRVLDLASYIAGPLGPRHLAALGADVIKVEAPVGDAFRSHSGFRDFNQAKRSVCLNLKLPAARAAFYDLVREADVVVENFRPDVSKRLGADYETLRAINPALVYLSAPGYGQHEAMAKRPAFDPLLQALSGAMLVQGGGREDSVPVLHTIPLNDVFTALMGAFGVVAALYHRARTGRGQRVVVSLATSACAIQAAEFTSYAGAAPAPAGGAGHAGPSATQRWYETATATATATATMAGDAPASAPPAARHVFVEAVTPAQRQALLRVVVPDMAVAGGGGGDAELQAALARAFRGASVDTWLARLGAAGVPCAPVTRCNGHWAPDAMGGALASAGLIVPVPPLPAGAAYTQEPSDDGREDRVAYRLGALVQVRSRDSSSDGAKHAAEARVDTAVCEMLARRRAPEFAEHTLPVLRALGYGGERGASLVASGAAVLHAEHKVAQLVRA